MVVNTCDFNICEKLRQKENCEFEASMGYTVKILSKVGEEQVEKIILCLGNIKGKALEMGNY